jgi:hypothetical protein
MAAARKEDPVSRTCEVPLRDGQVACPVRGMVDVELCYRCPRLRAFYDDESGTKVACAAPHGIGDGLIAALAAARPRLRL